MIDRYSIQDIDTPWSVLGFTFANESILQSVIKQINISIGGSGDNTVFAVEFTGEKPYPSAEAVLESPVYNLAEPHCVIFNCSVKSSLTIYKRSSAEVRQLKV